MSPAYISTKKLFISCGFCMSHFTLILHHYFFFFAKSKTDDLQKEEKLAMQIPILILFIGTHEFKFFFVDSTIAYYFCKANHIHENEKISLRYIENRRKRKIEIIIFSSRSTALQ